MNTENPIKMTVDKLHKAIEDRDLLNFSKERAKIVNFCRRALFHGDREAMGRWYPELSRLLIWFYRSGKGEWRDAERSMGGLELLLSLMRNFHETRTFQETLAEVRGSEVDREIIKILSRNPNGMRSGNLAQQLEKSQNSLTNRLPNLEKLGLIFRLRIGRNSVLYLTPKGRGVAEDLQREEIPETYNQLAAGESAVSQPYEDLTGQEQPPGKPMTFWPQPLMDRAQGETVNDLSARSTKRTYN